MMAGARAEERCAVVAQLDEAAANLLRQKRAVNRWPRVASPRVNPWTRLARPWARLKPVSSETGGRGADECPPRTEDIAMAEANLALAQANLKE